MSEQTTAQTIAQTKTSEDEFLKTEVSITMSVEKLNVVLAGLGELPAKASHGIINEIKQQVEKFFADKQESVDSEVVGG